MSPIRQVSFKIISFSSDDMFESLFNVTKKEKQELSDKESDP